MTMMHDCSVREEILAEIQGKHHFRFTRSQEYPTDDRNRKACAQLTLLESWVQALSDDDPRLARIQELWAKVFDTGERPDDSTELEAFCSDLSAREWDVLEEPLYDLGFRSRPFEDVDEFLQTLIQLAEECLESGPQGRFGQ